MSWQDYLGAQTILASGPSFFALLMATIDKADPDNRKKLLKAFPSEYEEWRQRTNAPAGKLFPFEQTQLHIRTGRERRR